MHSSATSALSTEQLFKLKVISDQARTLSKEQAQEAVIELFRQSMVKENLFKDLIKREGL